MKIRDYESISFLEGGFENVLCDALDREAAISRLPADQRYVHLLYFQGYTMAEIAELVQKSVSTVFKILRHPDPS